jgi:serine/threonine protein kinase
MAYIVMEYVNGSALSLRTEGAPQPPRAAAELVEQLARGIHFAHQQGVIHRDLKPANVLLAPPPQHTITLNQAETLYGVPKICDFGLVRLMGQEHGEEEGSIMGTPSYMAPEQASGRTNDIGPVTDIYGLGAVLYELLTGRPPFRGDTPWDTLDEVRNEQPVPPRRLQTKVPRVLEAVCLKCLEKDPARRYPSGQALADDLRCFLNGRSTVALPLPFWKRLFSWGK